LNKKCDVAKNLDVIETGFIFEFSSLETFKINSQILNNSKKILFSIPDNYLRKVTSIKALIATDILNLFA